MSLPLSALTKLLLTDPDKFMQELKKNPDHLSFEIAEELDQHDPLGYTYKMFEIDEKLIPFAGHSLGPLFNPVRQEINRTLDLQQKLHAGHFPDSHPKGKQSGHWFDCDREKESLNGAKQLLGFKEEHEFCFMPSGLSHNFGTVVETFFSPTKKDWQSGKSKILTLEGEFFSDQAVVASVLEREIQSAKNHECFNGTKKEPTPESEIIKIEAADKKNGLYRTEDIIKAIKDNADTIQMICLSDIVFNTGQRLELDKIFEAVGDIIKKNNIKVILDLAHTVGNRPVNLESMPITAAVGCAYKHLSGPAGSSLGIYVNRNVDLKNYPPIRGWKGADPNQVFQKINSYDASIMEKKAGATAFRTSNPPPLALHPAQVFLSEFGKIGFDKCFNKSECLTRYLIMQLQHHLGDKIIEIITPLDPKQRGATIAVRVKNNVDVRVIEEKLKEAGFEIDSRPPNILRMTAHYGYTKFTHINRFVTSLKKVLNKNLEHDEALHKKWGVVALATGLVTAFSLFAVSRWISGSSAPVASPKFTPK